MKFTNLSTADVRILVTLLCVLVTTFDYAFRGMPPSESWLIFLAAMSGIDVAQYIGRRVTTKDVPVANTLIIDTPVVDEGTATTDIQELRTAQLDHTKGSGI